MKKIILFAVFVFIGFLVFISWEALVFLNRPAGPSKETVYFEVNPGESIKSVARRLVEKDLIADDLRFVLFARLSEKTTVRVGEFALSESMYPAEVLDIIISGRSVQRSITIQEGFNKFEIAKLFESKGLGTAKEFLKWTDDAAFAAKILRTNVSSLEGYLFPETYNVTKFTGARGLIERMVAKFHEVYSELKPLNSVRMNQAQIVTLASIIEKETGAPEERNVISSVYHNRLRKPMRLQADPTVLYGIWVKTKKYKFNLTKKDLRTPTSYNTYTKMGLPEGPIANPGREALRAAMQPAKTDYIFFVSKNDGTHVFSENYEQHKRAVRKFQLNKAARENKSWRDLQKRGSGSGS